MKYIRTKDRIYELESDFLNNKGVRVGYNVVGQEEVVLIENNSIIQSDTIEELCDEFVLHYEPLDDIPIPWASYERRSNSWNKNKEMLVKELKNTSGRKPIVRGAIWTDKGLIYVAKMNDKGELELI